MIQFLPAVLSLLAAGGATYAANRQARAQQEELNRREQAERERQRAIQAEANARTREAITRFTPEAMERDVAAATQERVGGMAPAVAATPAPDYSIATGSAPKEVGADLGRRLAEARERGSDQASRQAKLRAYGDASLGQAFALTNAGRDIDRLRRNSQSSLGILQRELPAAANAGRRWGQASDIASLISQMAANYGATSPFGGAKPTDPF